MAEMARVYKALTVLALLGLVLAAVAALPVAAQQPVKFTRPLTLIFWKGSLIEVFLNYTEIYDQYRIGPTTYEFALTTPAGDLVTVLPVLIGDNSGHYCTVGYVYLHVVKGQYAWFSSSLPYTFKVGDYLYQLTVDTVYGVVAVWNVSDNKRLGRLKIYTNVTFADVKALEDAIKASPLNKGTIPAGGCQKLVEECASGNCAFRAYGLIVPQNVQLEERKYQLRVKPRTVTTWEFGSDTYMQAVNVESTNIIVRHEAGPDNVIAFGRVVNQVIPLANGSSLIVAGKLNVTLNYTTIKSIISGVYSSLDLAKYNVTVAYRLVIPELQAASEAGIILTKDNPVANYTKASGEEYLLLTNASSGTLPAKIYGGEFGVWRRTLDSNEYIVMNLTVNPNTTLPVVNTWIEAKYGMIPGLSAKASVLVRANETITAQGHVVVFGDVWNGTAPSALADKPVPFWAVVLSLNLPKGLTILPGTLYAYGYNELSDSNVFQPNKYGDNDVMNTFDVVNVVITNFVSNNTKFFIEGNEYILLGAADSNKLNCNVSASVEVVKFGEYTGRLGYVNASSSSGYSTSVCIGKVIYYNNIAKKYYGKFSLNYTLPLAPYAGNMYYLLPVFTLNLTSGNNVISFYKIVLLPPVNYTTVKDPVRSGDIKLESIGTVMRVRPFLIAFPVDKKQAENYLTGKSSSKVVIGTWLAIFGTGFDLADPKLTLYLGNYTVKPLNGNFLNAIKKIVTYHRVLPSDAFIGLNASADDGVFLAVIPLWKVTGEQILNGNAVGYFTVNLTGSGYNFDVASGTATSTNQNFDYVEVYELVPPSTEYTDVNAIVMVDPAIDTLEYCATYPCTPNVKILVFGPRPATPTAAYERITELLNQHYTLQGISMDTIINETHVMVIVAMTPPNPGTKYSIIYHNGATEVYVYNITADEIEYGVYVNHTLVVPLLPNNNYHLRVYNETAKTWSSDTKYEASVQIIGSVVAHADILKSVTFATDRLTGQGIVPTITALPKDVIYFEGYGWRAARTYVIDADNTPIIVNRTTESGTFVSNYTIPPYKAGTSIFFEVSDGDQHVALRVQVIEIKRNGLVVDISAWPVYYDDGTVKLPVIVTATYYDIPITCKSSTDVYVYVYVDHSTTPRVYKLSCIDNGVWYGVIDVETVKQGKTVPTYVLLVAKVEYKDLPATLTALKATAITIDPELKSYAASAMSAAEAAKASVDKLSEKVNNAIENYLMYIRESVDRISGKLDSIASALSMIESYVKDVRGMVDEVKGSIIKNANEIKAKLDTIASDITSVKNSIANLATTITNAVKSALANVATKDDISSLAEEIKGMISDESNKISSKIASSIAAAKNDIIAAIDSAVGDVKTTLTKSLGDLGNKLDEIKASVSDLAGKVATKSDVNAAVQQVSSALSDVKKAVSDVASKVDSVKAKVDSLAGSLSGIKSTVEGVNNKLGQLQNSVNNVSTSTMIFGAASLVVSIIVLILLIILAVKGGLLASH